MPLSLSQFKYRSKHPISGTGLSLQGLAYSPERETFFSIEKAGQDPFSLVEFTVPDEGPCRLVRRWGPINNGDPLKISGKQEAWMTGLLWDASRAGLWLSYGSYYASGVNYPCLAFLTIPEFKLHGPWLVPPEVHSDRCKGPLFHWTDSQFLGMFGRRGSTAQLQSWGTGLVTCRKPDLDLPAMSVLPDVEIEIHWPMSEDANGVATSRFPREPSDDPVDWIEKGGVYPYHTSGSVDGVYSVTPVDDTLVYFGSVGRGHSWYGNSTDQTSRESLLYPGQPCVSCRAARGNHCEQDRPKVYLTPLEHISSATKEVGYTEVADVASLGGEVALDQAETSQPVFDPDRRLLFAPNRSAIHVWRIEDDMSAIEELKQKVAEVEKELQHVEAELQDALNQLASKNDEIRQLQDKIDKAIALLQS